jgi:hypothetical protein
VGGFGVGEKDLTKLYTCRARKEVAALTTLGYSRLPSGYFPWWEMKMGHCTAHSNEACSRPLRGRYCKVVALKYPFSSTTSSGERGSVWHLIL